MSASRSAFISSRVSLVSGIQYPFGIDLNLIRILQEQNFDLAEALALNRSDHLQPHQLQQSEKGDDEIRTTGAVLEQCAEARAAADPQPLQNPVDSVEQ